jgi:hypothetical protein
MRPGSVIPLLFWTVQALHCVSREVSLWPLFDTDV